MTHPTANATPVRHGHVTARDWKSKAIAAGWNDYARGLPYRDEYNTAGELWQRHYEMGRCEAAAARSVAVLPILRLNRRINSELARCVDGQWDAAKGEMLFHAAVRHNPARAGL